MPDPTVPIGTAPPPPLDDFDLANMVEPEARRAGLDPDLILRQIKQESKGNPHAVSTKGAQGLMQLMPATSLAYGVKDPFDPKENIRAGVAYMAKLSKQYKGDQRQMLLHYNGGPAAVQAFAAGYPFKESTQYLAGIQPGAVGTPPPTPPTTPPPAPALPSIDESKMKGITAQAQGAASTPPSEDDFASANAAAQGNDFDAANKLAQAGEHPENFDVTGARAAQGATRLTAGYGPTVEFLRALPATAGAMAGSLVRRTGPVGAAIGTGVAALGAMGGEAITQGAEDVAHLLHLTDVPATTREGKISRMEEAAAAGVGGELFGRGSGAVIGKLAAPFKGTVDAEGQAVRDMFPNALPNQVADSHLLNLATNVAEKAPFTGSRIAERRALMDKAAQDKATQLLKQYGGEITPETAGKTFKDALESNTQAFKAHGAKLYADVDKAAQGVTVPLDSLQEYASKELERRGGVPGEVSGNRGLKMLKQVAAAGSEKGDEAASPALKQISIQLGKTPQKILADPSPVMARLRESAGITEEAPMSKDMTFAQAANFRSDLNAFIRRATHEKDDVAKGVAQQLLKRLDTAMDEAGTGASAFTPVTRVVDQGSGVASTKGPETWFHVGHLSDTDAAKVNSMYKSGKGRIERGYMPSSALSLGKNQSDEFGNKIASSATDAVRKFRTDLPTTDVAGAYRQANEFYRTGKQQYESALMRKLAASNPEAVARQIVKPGAVTPIRAARAAVTPEAWQGVQSNVAQDILKKATSEDGKTIDGSKLLGRLRELSKPTLQEIFPKDHADDLWEIGTVLDRAQRKSNTGGTIGIYLGQAGLITGALLHGHLPMDPGSLAAKAGVGTVMLGPYALSRIMTNPRGAKWLSVGLQAGPGTKLAAKAATHLLAQLAVDRDQGQEAPPNPQVGQPPPRP